MDNILVIGHKNPDTDSICSAYCYANLKSIIDSSKKYIACRCGNINPQTKFVFEKFNVTPPMYISDVFPKVSDIMTKEVISVNTDDSIFECMKSIESMKIGIVPVISNDNKLSGIVSYIELTEFFTALTSINRNEYLIKPENFARAINGFFLKKGEKDEFRGHFVVGAMPYDKFKERTENIPYDKIVLIVGNRKRIVDYAVQNQFAGIILTGIKDLSELSTDFSNYNGWVFVSELSTAETLSLAMLSVPAKSIMNTNLPTIKASDDIDIAKFELSKSDLKGLPVIDDMGNLVGLVTRMNFINNVRKKLILVDHNEYMQAVDGAESAEILEIIDHHRLGAIKTKSPIYIYTKPVGSTCTLVYELYKANKVEIDKTIAGLLLAGIMSDTVVLKSPTTTNDDKQASLELSKILGIDYLDFGSEIFSVADNIKVSNPEEVITNDIKIYNEYGFKVGISQIEVVSFSVFYEYKDILKTALLNIKKSNGLDWAMLMVTDIIKGDSLLLTTTFEQAERIIPYKKVEDNLYLLSGVLSRKKQLLPEILRILEELSQSGKRR